LRQRKRDEETEENKEREEGNLGGDRKFVRENRGTREGELRCVEEVTGCKTERWTGRDREEGKGRRRRG